MKTRLVELCILMTITASVCNAGDLAGSYRADVTFSGKDPRYVGQRYEWRLTLKEDGTFVFSFELPMAVYMEDGSEQVGKASSVVSGRWSRTEKGILLRRKEGEAVLGSTDTTSFPFDKDTITLQLVDAGLKLQEDARSLELRNIPNQPSERTR